MAREQLVKGMSGKGTLEYGWARVARRGFAWFALALFVTVAFVWIIDPYDTLPFSPDFDRAPSTTNQRFGYPAVAMNPDFDSLVIGTSVVRLLKPSDLEEAFGGRFANLAMNSGMPFEQSQIFDLFRRHHDRIRTVVFGIDEVWCRLEAAPKFTPRPFPPWLYDDNRWNDALYLLNMPGLEQAGRQLAQLLGLRKEKYQRNGYRVFLPPVSEYDLEKVRQTLYTDGNRTLPAALTPPKGAYADFRAGLTFPDLKILRDLATSLPGETTKIFLISPVHAISVARPGSEDEALWRECVSQIAKIGAEAGNAHVLDFRIRSEITTEDRHYWDNLHFGVETASRVVRLMSDGVTAGKSTNPAYRYVTADDGGF